MDFPLDFRCPISMELMKDPVTISTGVSYERKHIEKWFHSYHKKTCPATMQNLDNFDVTPNHTLKRLILAWSTGCSSSSSSPKSSVKNEEFVALLNAIDSSCPFIVSSLQKLRSIVQMSEEIKRDFRRCGGVKVLVEIVVQILIENSDFMTFRACEEALGVLHELPLSEDDETVLLLSKPECVKAMAIMLQRGSAQSRFCTISIFHKMARVDYDWKYVVEDQGIDFFKALLELASDEMGTKASSCALQVLIDILTSSKKSRLKAIEAGAMCTLIELLPDSSRSKCEKVLELIKLLCKCADGRLAFIEHGIGIAAITKKMLHVSFVSTKNVVKILWLVCSFNPTNIRVIEEMLFYGSVLKLEALLHIDGGSSTKDKVVKLLKLHGSSWMRYPCFPCELKDFLSLSA
ncbi:hypothetical protein DCAR_0934033 [Daucus carota subsp. sativus]|uniref:U-box domain-containing protein n=1 Tax=Daucus carota subsp. sativus TaxID=79200 RepID=A0A175YEM2_DAUCS|nr:PREDICTED: E3 ubiquitin-protein ligase PUB22-like [Daucus carota subsp. sativus]WOH14514.1 hypothetical protein DCAR_0934033 [Daucus carota subsp. sativus]